MSGVSTASRASMRPSRALYSARSMTGSRRSTAARALGVISLKSTCSGDCSSPGRSTDDVPICQCRNGLRVRSRARLAEPHEVAVGVEDHHRQPRRQQDALEQHAERVGLARAALAAPEGVPVEPLRDERDAHLGVVDEVAEVQLRVRSRQEGLHGRVLGRAQRGLRPSAPARPDALAVSPTSDPLADEPAPAGSLTTSSTKARGPPAVVELEVVADARALARGPPHDEGRARRGTPECSAAGDRSTSSFAAMRP